MSRDSPRESGGGGGGGQQQQMSLNQQTLKQRVNMVVMRMIAQNSDQDQRSALQPQVEARPQVSIALIKQCVDPDRSLKLMLDRTLKLGKVKNEILYKLQKDFLMDGYM